MRAFWKNEQGNVALIFAIAAFPVLAAVGSAIDYTRAVNARTAMQSALDNAALMLSKDAPSLSAAEVTKRGQEIFAALLKRPDLAGVTVSSTYTPNTGKGSKLEMVANVKIATVFMKIAGYPNLNLDVRPATAQVPPRIHLDLYAEDQAAEVERLLSLGATRVNWRPPVGADYIVLADPEGNRFCVIDKGG